MRLCQRIAPFDEEALQLEQETQGFQTERESMMDQFTESESVLRQVKIEHDELAQALRSNEEELKIFRNAKEDVVGKINQLMMTIQEEEQV